MQMFTLDGVEVSIDTYEQPQKLGKHVYKAQMCDSSIAYVVVYEGSSGLILAREANEKVISFRNYRPGLKGEGDYLLTSVVTVPYQVAKGIMACIESDIGGRTLDDVASRIGWE